MKSALLSVPSILFCATLSYAQVGIGTTTPKAFFNVVPAQTVLFGQDTNQVGSQNKLIWYASQGAFRVGGVSNNNWTRLSANDLTKVGVHSFASGFNTMASGEISTAMGNNVFASGFASTGMGFNTLASGFGSMALGTNTTSSGFYSIAIGNNATANGDNSTAMGVYVSTKNQLGSFIIGDATFFSTLGNDGPNQMMMRFSGGYKLFTNSNATIGVSLSNGGNAWQTLSDSTRKENFRSVDGAGFLHKISSMRLGSWNYKGQDVKQHRHYGPMAQEFFAAFGHDELGTIGEDKSINQADFDGVNLIAIQALIKKVEKLEAENAVLKQQAVETAALKSDMEQIKQQLNKLLSPQVDKASANLRP